MIHYNAKNFIDMFRMKNVSWL